MFVYVCTYVVVCSFARRVCGVCMDSHFFCVCMEAKEIYLVCADVETLVIFPQEIINVSKSMKTSGLKVFLVEGVSRDEEKAKEMQANLEYCVLRNIVQYTQIIYDPDPKQTVVDEDADFVMDFVQMEEAAEDEV